MTVRRQSARMDDTFGDALMVEVENLFAQDEVFEERRAARARPQAVVIVRNRNAVVRRQDRLTSRRDLMHFATDPTRHSGAGQGGAGWRQGNGRRLVARFFGFGLRRHDSPLAPPGVGVNGSIAGQHNRSASLKHFCDDVECTAGLSRYLARSTCSNSSSTGVARPKMLTDTLTRLLSKSSSSTMPLKLAKGPSSTLTLSPIS